MSGRSRRLSGEQGSGTILVLAVALILGVVMLSVVLVGQATTIRHRAESAADLAALAGADQARVGGDACAAAQRTAQLNGARVMSCSTASAADGPVPAVGEVTVVVAVSAAVLGGRTLAATARARAGQAAP
jgi:secretion/DNA translocation related TadE-like protein